MKVDLGERLQFPEVVQTSLRSDVMIILIKLIIPWELRCDQAIERKSAKYHDLLRDCREKGWQGWVSPVKVGSRGYPVQSVWSMLSVERRAKLEGGDGQ